jgi:RluA family pseudouridine synthase
LSLLCGQPALNEAGWFLWPSYFGPAIKIMSNCIKLSAPQTKEFWEIPVLFEDGHLLALYKPSGLLCCPDRYDPRRPNLMSLLRKDLERGAVWVRERNISYLANAHRLDFETSGIILLAKEKPVLVALVNQLNNETPHKKFTALVRGLPHEMEFSVLAKIAPHPIQVGLMRVDPDKGKKSITHFKVKERFLAHTLLECQPLTDRTHQIRVHLRSKSLPIVGDRHYGGKPLWLSELKADYRLKPGREENPLMNRAALHAEQLVIKHPVTEAEMVIEAPWPKDLTVAVKYLRKYAATGTTASEASAHEMIASNDET